MSLGKRTLRLMITASVLAGALSLSCTDRIVTDGNEAADELTATSDAIAEIAPGIWVSAADQEDRLYSAARDLALALGHNALLRQELKTALEASSRSEGKVPYADLLDAPSNSLLAELAALAEKPQAAVRSSVRDSLVDLELYFPVDSHRNWTGGPMVYVATLFSDDPGFSIHAYDLQGRRVQLSMDSPPDVPTLALVPAEKTSENGMESPGSGIFAVTSTEPTVLRDMSSGGPGLYMTYSYIPDLHEPWILGDPEIAVHLARKEGSTMEWRACAGDAQSGNWFFNQDNHTWSGEVKVADSAQVKDQDFEIHVWEDDWARCNGEDNLKPHQSSGFLSDLVDSAYKVGLAVYEGVQVIGQDTVGVVDKIKAGAAILVTGYHLAGALQHDDYVGVMEQLPNGCFTALTGPQSYYLRDQNDNHTTGRVEIDNNFADRDLCPLEVEIDGPEEVLGCSEGLTPEGEYRADVFGGQGATTYEWYEDLVLRSTSSVYILFNEDIGQRRLDLIVSRGAETDSTTTWVDIIEPEVIGGEEIGCEYRPRSRS